MTIQRPRGTRDFLPEETEKRGLAKKAMQDVLERWGYREVATPTFEHLELFTIKSGASVIGRSTASRIRVVAISRLGRS